MALQVPSKLIFLRDLPSSQPGSKVRFLGSIDSYNTTTGELHLSHNHSHSTHQAIVTIELVRERLHPRTLADGGWVNVIGYVQRTEGEVTWVQATMLWGAEALSVPAYEDALGRRLGGD